MGEESASVGAVYLLAPPHAGTDSMSLGLPVRFLGEDDPNDNRSGTTGIRTQAAEEADHFSCIL